ncbi:MAG: hypothetical protein ACTSXQ_01220 [Alphaproteobacteria bacterium]
MENKNFNWAIDSSEYLSNKNKHADKLNVKEFIKKISHDLNVLKGESWKNIRSIPHNHSCKDIGKKRSNSAKKLHAHLKKINEDKGETEGNQVEPFQIGIKSFRDKKEFRVYGYIEDDVFHLIYLDPDHDVYKQ